MWEQAHEERNQSVLAVVADRGKRDLHSSRRR